METQIPGEMMKVVYFYMDTMDGWINLFVYKKILLYPSP
jgi:hypothetical protein